MPRPVNKIAAEIDTLLRDIEFKHNPLWVRKCRPYVAAMLQLRSFKEYYGIDAGSDIGMRFLQSASPWRGDDARRIKDEIRNQVKEAQLASN